MAAHVELPEWVNERTVEEAYRLCRIAQATRRQSFAEAGMRAARARDPRLLKALEGMSEVLLRQSERQFGPTFNVGGLRVQATEYQLFRNAYTQADKGDADAHYEWQYGAAAVLAGIVR
jgi:hypothetical protein